LEQYLATVPNDFVRNSVWSNGPTERQLGRIAIALIHYPSYYEVKRAHLQQKDSLVSRTESVMHTARQLRKQSASIEQSALGCLKIAFQVGPRRVARGNKIHIDGEHSLVPNPVRMQFAVNAGESPVKLTHRDRPQSPGRAGISYRSNQSL
jgi:hypothetical protein